MGSCYKNVCSLNIFKHLHSNSHNVDVSEFSFLAHWWSNADCTLYISNSHNVGVSEFSFLAHWWSNADCMLYISREDQKKLGTEHSVCMVNHTYEIDWLMAWMMAERHGMLGVISQHLLYLSSNIDYCNFILVI